MVKFFSIFLHQKTGLELLTTLNALVWLLNILEFRHFNLMSHDCGKKRGIILTWYDCLIWLFYFEDCILETTFSVSPLQQ